MFPSPLGVPIYKLTTELIENKVLEFPSPLGVSIYKLKLMQLCLKTSRFPSPLGVSIYKCTIPVKQHDFNESFRLLSEFLSINYT